MTSFSWEADYFRNTGVVLYREKGMLMYLDVHRGILFTYHTYAQRRNIFDFENELTASLSLIFKAENFWWLWRGSWRIMEDDGRRTSHAATWHQW
jgi:hypothetical protein